MILILKTHPFYYHVERILLVCIRSREQLVQKRNWLVKSLVKLSSRKMNEIIYLLKGLCVGTKSLLNEVVINKS